MAAATDLRNVLPDQNRAYIPTGTYYVAMEETRIDTAPTPAPVFAYRAFRGIFYGSPESSPVRPHDIHEETLNKENESVSPLRAPRFTTSPIKSKRKDVEDDLAIQGISLTPKKQKITPVSPSKSILKNTNGLTPRRIALRDATVTFKDLSLSMSPETARRPSPRRVRSLPAAVAGKSAIQVPNTRRVSPQKRAGATSAQSVEAPNVTIRDVEAYRAQTEKETRRLIKYGQKWRDQAKKVEAENAKLRALLEQAQRQNARLEKKIANIEPVRSGFSPERYAAHRQLSSKVRKASLEQKANELLRLSEKPRTGFAMHQSAGAVEVMVDQVYSRDAVERMEPAQKYATMPGALQSDATMQRTGTIADDSGDPGEAKGALAGRLENDGGGNKVEQSRYSFARSTSQPVAMTADKIAAARARIEARNRLRVSSNILPPCTAMQHERVEATSKDTSKLPISEDSAFDWAGV